MRGPFIEVEHCTLSRDRHAELGRPVPKKQRGERQIKCDACGRWCFEANRCNLFRSEKETGNKANENRVRMTNLPVAYTPCDFPLCSAGCWIRCNSNGPCWDGRQAHWHREVWKAIRRAPRQDDLFGVPHEHRITALPVLCGRRDPDPRQHALDRHAQPVALGRDPALV